MQGPEETFAAYLVDQTRQDTDNIRDIHVRLSALPKRQPHRSQKDRGWARFAASCRILWVTLAVYPIAKGMGSPTDTNQPGSRVLMMNHYPRIAEETPPDQNFALFSQYQP